MCSSCQGGQLSVHLTVWIRANQVAATNKKQPCVAVPGHGEVLALGTHLQPDICIMMQLDCSHHWGCINRLLWAALG